jgi:hypothetical protein
MMSNWKDVPDDLFSDWQTAFLSSREIHLSVPCPVCNETLLFQFYQLYQSFDEWDNKRGLNQKGYIGRGGYWQWCQSCRSFAHYSGLIPDWWKCDLEIDPEQLTPYPDAIEDALGKYNNL